MGHRASLGVVQKRKVSCSCPDSNAGPFSPCRGAIATELSLQLDTVFIEVQIVIGLRHQNNHHHKLSRIVS